VALQGAGSVGCHLGKHLFDSGAKVYFTDISEANIARFKEIVPNSEFVSPNDIYDMKADIYAPCALGATINDQTIDRLKVKIVAGAANNQLAENRHGDMLKEKGILYAPDYLINAGGVMNVSIEFEGWSAEKATKMVDKIFDTTLKIFKLSDEQNIPDLMAEQRIAAIKNIKGKYLGNVSHRFPGRKSRQ
jgi:leucine dehydrogenase